MTRVPALLIGLALAPSLASAHPLGEAALDMEPGEWRELPTQNMSVVMDTTNGGVPEYGDSAAWDPGNDRFYAHGQGHEGGWGMFRVVSFDAESNSWESLGQPPWYASYPHGISHGYDHNAFDPDTGTYYLRPFQFNQVYTYDTASQTWGELPQILDWSEYVGCCGGLVHFPEMDALVIVASGVVGAYDYASQSWSELAGSVSMGGYHNFAEYSPSEGAVIFGGGPDGGGDARQIHRLDADGSITELGLAPVPLGTTAAVVTVDPVSGTFLVIGEGGILHGFDLATDAWGVQSDEVPLPVFNTLAAPVSDHGVVMFANWDTGDPGVVYLYKMSPFTPDPEGETSSTGSSDATGDPSTGDADTGDPTSPSGDGDGDTGSGVGTATNASDGGSSGGSGASGASGADDSDSGGCNCRSASPSAFASLCFLGFVLGRRRRTYSWR